MADISTSIKIGADASQAITEMQRLQSATDKLKQTGQDINIQPKVDAGAVQDLKNTLSSAAVEVPVTVKTKVEDAAAAAAAAGAAVAGAAAAPSAVSTPLAASLANEQAAASALQKLSNQVAENSITNDKRVTAAKNAVIGAHNQQVLSLARLTKAVKDLGDMETGLGPHFEGATEAIDAQRKKVEELTKAHENTNKALGAARENLKRVSEAAKESAAAVSTATTAVGGWRGALAGALESYKNFSTGANAGVENFKSLSLNIIADIELIKRAAQAATDFGIAIANGFRVGTDAAKEGLIADALNNITDAANPAAIKQYQAEIDKLNNILNLMNEEGLTGLRNILSAAFREGVGFQDLIAARKELEKLQSIARAGAANTAKKKRDEELDKEAFARAQKIESGKIAMLEGRAKIEAQTAFDIAALEKQLQYEKNILEQKHLKELIEQRKVQEKNQIADFEANEKKKRDDAAKAEADRIQTIQDEARAAEIATLDERAKIEESYLFDLDKINRRLAAAQTKEEQDAAIRIAKARKAQRDREFKDYNDAQKKAMDENAAQMKEAARENAEYQKSLLEDLVGYQRQLVASFSGLQQSIFPKEAMNYLRQIAGASNRLPP